MSSRCAIGELQLTHSKNVAATQCVQVMNGGVLVRLPARDIAASGQARGAHAHCTCPYTNAWLPLCSPLAGGNGAER
eukprot:scaffold141721_cov28-Tisochrysis_lutea.AAC.2